MLLVLAIIFFLLLVVVHEYGHFLAAKRNGVEVEEFGIGFPPKIAGKTMGRGIFRSYYTINLLPLGGFVRLKGENDSATGKGTFGAASFWVKTKIILAGVLMNFLTAFLIFTVLAFVGLPQLVEDQYERVDGQTIARDHVVVAIADEGSPAEAAGLQLGDRLVSIGGVTVEDTDQLSDITEQFAGQTTEVIIERSGEQQNVAITMNAERSVLFNSVQNDDELLNFRDGDRILSVNGQAVKRATEVRDITDSLADESIQWTLQRGVGEPFDIVSPVPFEFTLAEDGYFGVAPLNLLVHKYDALNSVIVGAGTTYQLSYLTYEGLVTLFSNLFSGNFSEAGDTVSGPVGVVVILTNATTFGLIFMLFFIGVISLTLAIMNSLPIPALDGGRLFVSGLFKLLRKPLNKDLEQRIHGTGFAVLMALILLITVIDIGRFF